MPEAIIGVTLAIVSGGIGLGLAEVWRRRTSRRYRSRTRPLIEQHTPAGIVVHRRDDGT